jgi:hypothetical protein
MARPVQRAVARQVAAPKFTAHVVHLHSQPPGKEVSAIAANSLGPPDGERVGVAPLGRPRDDDNPGGKMGTLPA